MPHLKPKTLYLTLSALMVGLVAIVYGALLLYERSRSDALMLQQAGAAAKRIGREAAATVDAELRPARVSVSLLASGALASATSEAQRLAALPQLVAALRGNVSVSAVYAGTASGSFLLLRRLEDAAARSRMGAPADAAFGLQSVDRDGGEARGSYRFLDAELRELQVHARPDYVFDARTRPWYALARRAGDGQAVQSEPYLFFTTGEPGVTLAEARGAIVVGADVSLQALSSMLTKPQISRSAELLIATAGGELLAEARRDRPPPAAGGNGLRQVGDTATPLMRTLWARRDAGGSLAPVQQVDGREWVAQAVPLPGSQGGDIAAGAALTLLMAAPREELQAFQIESRRHGLYISLGLMLLLLPLVHLLADRVSRPLRELAREAEAIRHFEFNGPDPKRSLIREVDRLAVAMTAMKHALRHFLDISAALSAERDFDTLLDLILRETIAVAEASGGAVHLLSADGRLLQPAASRLHGETAQRTGLTWDVSVPDSLGAPVQALRADGPVEVDLSWDNPGHLKAYESLFAGLSASRLRLLSMPLKNRQDQTLGALTLSFAMPGQGPGEPLAAARVAFVRALSGTAAVAIDNQLLLRARKELLQSFIQLAAGAIEARSADSASHSQRVPELARMLAQAACDASEGPYAGFGMTADEWEALHIAAGLHDCGRGATPECIGDKASRLETLYNRITEVRSHFEVCKDDVLIERVEAGLGAIGTARARRQAAPAASRLAPARMSPQARMLVIADVFEALTADARPRPPGKPLSQALAMLARMAREQQLDAELLDLFLRSGACMAYARRFMAAELVDVEDLAPYLSSGRAG